MGLVCILTSEAWIELLVRISLTVGFPASTVVTGALVPEDTEAADSWYGKSVHVLIFIWKYKV